MNENKVLATCFTDNLRIRFIMSQIFTDLPPKGIKGRSGAGEMETTQITACRYNFADHASLPRYKIDNAVR